MKFFQYVLHTLYWLLFVIVAIITWFHVGDVIQFLSTPPEDLKYPFGPESGFKYCSRETYFALAIVDGFIGLVCLASSFIFYRQKKILLALTFIASPLLMYYLTSILIDPSGRLLD